MSSLINFNKYAAAVEQPESPVSGQMWGPTSQQRPGFGDFAKTILTGGGNGVATGIRGLAGAGIGALAGRLLGGHTGKGALIGAGIGLLPDIIRHAPTVINAVKGLFTKQSSAVFHQYFPKQAAMGDLGLLAAAGLGMGNIANNGIGVNSADLNKIDVPEGALPPEQLLLPAVKREGQKAAILSVLKNLGVGTATGAGLGALANLLYNDGDSKKGELIAAALGGGILGAGGGAIGALWNTPDARLEAMLKKHNELYGKSSESEG